MNVIKWIIIPIIHQVRDDLVLTNLPPILAVLTNLSRTLNVRWRLGAPMLP